MRFLSLLLLGPWLLILAWAYWAYPKSLPRPPSRRVFDGVALLLAAVATSALAAYVYDSFARIQVDQLGRHSGAIWRHVAPVIYAYAGFSMVLLLALIGREWIWRRD